MSPDDTLDMNVQRSDTEVDEVRPVFSAEPLTNPGDGSLTFYVNAIEMMRFQADGKIFVRGQQVDDNQMIYAQFREWLEQVRKDAGLT